MMEIPGGTVTIRATTRSPPYGHYPFGWDNEFDRHEVSVPCVCHEQVQSHESKEHLDSVRAGARPPHFWKWQDGQWYWRGMWQDVPLPLDWPVYVTHEEVFRLCRLDWQNDCPPKRNFIEPPMRPFARR